MNDGGTDSRDERDGEREREREGSNGRTTKVGGYGGWNSRKKLKKKQVRKENKNRQKVE